MHRMTIAIATATTIAALGLPAAAGAHVTLQPSAAEAGGYTVLDVRVPNETDDQNTTKVDVAMPDGFSYAAYQKVPGWTAEIAMEKAPRPIESEGETTDRQVSRITFTSTGRASAIAPGQFQDFPISVRIPDGTAGAKLSFKALQTYTGGEVVRWIGAPDSERPAPQVTLTSASAPGAAPAPVAAATPVAAQSDAGDGADTVSVIALVVGALGLIAGLLGLLTARGARRRPA